MDSYVIDTALAKVARSKLEEEGQALHCISDTWSQRVTGSLLGYGIHINGTSEWNGRTDAFSQYVVDGSVAHITDKDYGVFKDVHDFYANARGGSRVPSRC